MLLALLLSASGQAQETEQITVASMNIDGLPKKVLVFNIKPDGPGSEGSSRIGKYMRQKNYDIICMQEDFNFHDVIVPWLEDNYQVDPCSGRIDYDVKEANLDLRYPQNARFPADGLACAKKNGIFMTASERKPWNNNFGKFSHSWDAMPTKGFRRQDLTLPSGTQIIVYNMHMDASENIDELEGKDSLDRDARLAQWIQLREDVLSHLNDRPIVVAGDMNSYYWRDKIKSEFIDVIDASGKGKCSDVWVEIVKQGNYPEYTNAKGLVSDGNGWVFKGESLDKILYINPTSGPQLQAVSCVVDSVDYKYNGKMLGDHYPLVATFAVKGGKTAIDNVTTTADEAATEYYNLNGQRIDAPVKGLFIERKGKNTVKKIK